MIVAAERLKKCQYLDVHKQLGIHDDNKRKRGRPRNTTSALNRQPAERASSSSDSSSETDTSSSAESSPDENQPAIIIKRTCKKVSTPKSAPKSAQAKTSKSSAAKTSKANPPKRQRRN